MKHKLWLFQIPIAALFSFAFYVLEAGYQGTLDHPLLRGSIYPALKTISGQFTNLKFQSRGPIPVKNKVVVVEIDSDAIAALGRWPWHRDITAYLVDRIFQAGAKVVGLDMVFSEPDQRIPEELGKVLQQNKLGHLIEQFETDFALEKVVQTYKNKLVLGYTTDRSCQPKYSDPALCPIGDPAEIEKTPASFERFAYQIWNVPPQAPFVAKGTQLISTPDLINNIPMYTDHALHAGYFNAWPDPDAYIRRTNLVLMLNGKPYPSLPLEMARVGLDEELALDLTDSGLVHSIEFKKSGRKIPTSPLGWMDINFRGPALSFQYIRALEVLKEEDQIQIEKDRTIVTTSKSELLRDAYVLVGISALGVHDMRAFPFDSNTPGVEGHANILDNLLTGDMLLPSKFSWGKTAIFLLILFGALAFAYLTERLESVPALLLFIGVLSTLGLIDFKWLFTQNINANLSLFYIELSLIFLITMALKYVMEERNKKFIKGAFAKYVAPAIIDSIMKDPTKLTVGGEKKELSILFSDIRSFTTFSEKMDAKTLAQFLNEYLGVMTDLVFDNQGTLDKYIGDAVMAFWGAPLDQKSHALNSCNAAIKMQKALAEMRPKFKEKYNIDVNIGIGINSGAVNVGNMGSERIFEYTVIGDHVNLASRLEGLTKPYGASILTTRFTFDCIQTAGDAYPPHRVLDFVKVKGKKQAVELIQLLEVTVSDADLKLFEQGRKLYSAQKWDEAIACFEKLKNDDPAQMYVERCKEFKLNPPATDWDGSWEMHSK